jgi:membrane protease YdiL (CAAX protease family)
VDPARLAGQGTIRAALLVPVLEELFWRGWLPRWSGRWGFWM